MVPMLEVNTILCKVLETPDPNVVYAKVKIQSLSDTGPCLSKARADSRVVGCWLSTLGC